MTRNRTQMFLARAAALLFCLSATRAASAQQPDQCYCGSKTIERGMVSYGRNGDRQNIASFDAGPGGFCRSISVEETAIFIRGKAEQFYLERGSRMLEQNCGVLGSFVKRDKTYDFQFDQRDSRPIDEMPPRKAAPAPQAASNANLWTAMTVDPGADGFSWRAADMHDPSREFNRSSWVLARKKIVAYELGVLKEPAGYRVVRTKTKTVPGGQAGQIEAVREDFAIVRFYAGSMVDRFAVGLRTWYRNSGGPYGPEDEQGRRKDEDGLFTQSGARILEVSLDDIVEINDYFDRARTNTTANSAATAGRKK